MRTCVIFNPAAKGEKARRFRRLLDAIETECALRATTSPGSARALATTAVRDGFQTIVAAGGDGTLNEVLNGIADAGGFDRCRLGVLPLGTINVFAREIGLPQNPEQAWQCIRAGREMRVDVPFVVFDEKPVRRYFAQLAGAGLDARAIELVHWPLKKRFGPFAYIIAGLRAICGKACSISVQAGGRTVNAELVLIGNGRFYGGSIVVFPGADLRDGLLEICAFPKASWLTLARCTPGLLAGKLADGCVEYIRAESVTLTSAESVPFEVDGEWVGRLPATFGVEREKLRVICP